LKRPNILLVTTDQQRKDTLGCYGNDLIKTPNIDRLANEGIRFNRAYCENPICIPSRITMLTGKTSAHHGAVLHNASIRDSEKTIAGLLTENGYRTHFVGKPHFKSQGHYGTEESVLDWRDGRYDDWNGPYVGFQTVEMVLGHSNIFYGHYGKWLRQEHAKELDCFMDKQIKNLDVSCGRGVFDNHIPESLHSSTYVAERSSAFIKQAAGRDEPFFCFASFPDPHWPILPPPKYFHMYDDVELLPVVPYNGEADKDNYPITYKISKRGEPIPYDGNSQHVNNIEDIDKIRRAYWGSISFIDYNIKKILDTLVDKRILEDTIIIFTTDHGEYMGSHGLMAKGGFLYEDYINLPFIVRYPKRIAKGSTSDGLFSFVDLAPTILDLVDVDKSVLPYDGISQADVLFGRKDCLRDCVTIHHPTQKRNSKPADQHALVTERWKLVYHAGETAGELFDLKEDPNEVNNLYNHPDYEKIQRQLTIRLLDEMILNNDKDAVLQQQSGQEYKPFIMKYEVWKPEFDALHDDK